MSKAIVSIDQLRQGVGPIHRRLSRCGHELTIPAKLVLYNLLERLGANSTVWPSQLTIASDTDISESSVRRGLRELERLGFVNSKQRGLGQTNVYTLELGAILDWSKIGTPDRSRSDDAERSEQSERPTEGNPIEGSQIEALSVPAEPRVKSIPLPKATKITEAYLVSLHGEYDSQIGSQQVGESITYWLGHQGFRMQTDKQAFLRKKLGEQVERFASNGNGRFVRDVFNPVASEAYMLPEVRVSK